MYLKANAKINIVLNVLKNNSKKNYHYLNMVVLPINFYDKIVVLPISNKEKSNCIFIKNCKQIFFKNNICDDVINMLTTKYKIKKKYKFIVYKNIPIQSGLGGESSDVASIFKFYNKKFNLKISNEEAINMLSFFGSDIPFFILNKPAQIQGFGDIIKPIKVLKKYYVLIIKPEYGLNAKDVYAEFDKKIKNIKKYNIKNVIQSLKNGNDELLIRSCGNNLESIAIQKCPEIEKIKRYLIINGFPLTIMSGSGTSVFSLTTSKNKILKIISQLKKEFVNCTIFYTTIKNN